MLLVPDLLVAAPAPPPRLEVFPVFFLPSDVYVTQTQLAEGRKRLQRHLAIAQAHFRRLLGVETFAISRQIYNLYRSPHPNSRYVRSKLAWQVAKWLGHPDSAHLMAKELLAWQGETRYTSNKIFLGFELFFNGKRVNGPESSFYTIRQARESCSWNRQRHRGTLVECRYDGRPF